MHIDGPIKNVVIPLADFIEQGLTGLDPPTGLGQRDEQIVLDRRQGQRHIAQDRGAGSRSNPQRPHHKLFIGAGFRILGTHRSTSDRTQSRQQFSSGEGLGQVIIGPHFQANDAVGFIASGREHQHRHIHFGPDTLEDLEAIQTGQHEIEENRMPRLCNCPFHSFWTGMDRLDGIAHGSQIIADETAEFPIIINDQDPWQRVAHW